MAGAASSESVRVITAMVCTATADVSAMQKREGQTRVGAGIDADGQSLYEIVVSKDGSFTIIRRDADGMTCLMAAGKSWLSYKLPVDGEDL